MKILHIIPTLRRAGAERLVLDICNGLCKYENIEVLLVVMHEQNEYPELSENINIHYCKSRVIPSFSGKSKIDLDDFIKIVKEFKPDIIHSHLFEAEILSRWIIFPGIVYITHCHDNMSQLEKFSFLKIWSKKKITNFFERRILLKCYKKCDNNFMAISQDTKDFYIKNIPFSRNKIFLLHNAIQIDRFNKGIKDRNLNKNEVVLITAGRLVDRKNHVFLIDVVSDLVKMKLNVKLFILGSGPNRKMIEEKIIREKLTNYIFLTGDVENIEDYYQKADIYVHSATYEPFGLVLIEAMAAGLPVVCLDGKGNRDIIEQGKNGFMIYEQNSADFASKIIELINNENQYQVISKYAKQYASNYNIETCINKLVEYYNQLL